MKKTIAAAFTLIAFATGVTFAQGGYPYGQNDGRGYGNGNSRYDRDYDRDEVREDIKIDRLDALVGLSRRQEKELHRIEDRYDRVMNTSRLTPDGFRQLKFRKRQDMLAVLTSAQRDRLFDAQQQYGARRHNGYGPFGRRN